MENIWSFLVQTVTVSLVAILILFLKRLFLDKLPPRWQYGIWGILALRILVPVTMKRFILLPVPLWIETLKFQVEQRLSSSYTHAFGTITVKHVFPVIHGAPTSITDWLFLLYGAGIIFSLFWYLVSYIRLRLRLRTGSAPTAELILSVREICERYRLRSPCHIKMIPGLPSAFVCGVFHPTLVWPAGKEPEDKILLHELLHVKYLDAFWSVVWCVLRSLHWCNPFLQYVFYRIGNDMESLCDQRVLERLEGESRREYGLILLAMANDKYARFPGTTSISNGGKNIARRIEAITRFRKYPQEMLLVSICILVALISPALIGTAASCDSKQFWPEDSRALDQAMSMTRIQRCTTVAGALDTYAKGLLLKNGIYIASASSLSLQKSLYHQLHSPARTEQSACFLDVGPEFAQINPSQGYRILNLMENPDGSCRAILVFSLSRSHEDPYCLWIPVTVCREDAWVVEESGERVIANEPFGDIEVQRRENALPYLRQMTASTPSGVVTVSERNVYQVDNAVQQNTVGFWGSGFDDSPKLNACFSGYSLWGLTDYTLPENASGPRPAHSVAILTANLDSIDQDADFSLLIPSPGSSSSTGNTSCTCQSVSEHWDGTLANGHGTGIQGENIEIVELPAAYRVRIMWDDVVMEEVTLCEEVK